MKKSKWLVVCLSAGLLAACGQPVGSSASLASSSKATSQSTATSSKATSNSTKASSAASTAASSQADSSTSVPDSASSSTGKTPVTDTFDVTAADLYEEAGHVYYSMAGDYNNALAIKNPKLYIRNGDTGASTYNGAFVLDEVNLTYAVKVDITDVTNGEWHDFKVFLNEDGAATGEVMKDSLPAGVYDKTVVTTLSTGVKKTYAFKEWSGYLKLAVTIEDTLTTSFSSMNYAVKEDGVYFQLHGINQHASPKLIIKDDKNSYEVAEAAFTKGENDSFVAEIKVSDSILTASEKMGIHFTYVDAIAVSHDLEITNKNLGDLTLKGVSYNARDYVFRVDQGGDTLYYKLGTTTDKFVMDTVTLKAVDDKAILHFSGVISSDSDKSALSFVLDESEFSVAIAATSLDANGYLAVDIDVTDAPILTGMSGDSNVGALDVKAGTTSLNNFWPNDWSLKADVLGPITVGSSTYQITYGQWGKYTLAKAAVA
jgi:hypothetical protein